MTRDERQIACANAWRDNKAIGTIVAVTGFGKTRLTLDHIVSRTLKSKPIHVHILVHREKLKLQWQERIKHRIERKLQKYVSVETVQWYIANNATVHDYDLLIVDEIHRFYGSEYINFINGERIPTKWRLGLTATPKDRQGSYPIGDLYPIVDEVTQEEALSNGWVADFLEFNLPVKLTPEEMEQYKYASELIAKNRAKFPDQNNFGAIMKCLHGDNQYSNIAYATMWAQKNGWKKGMSKENEVYKMWNPKSIIGYASNCMKGYRLRSQVINHCENKYKATIALLEKFKSLKTICFSESTRFADELNRQYEKVAAGEMITYHTQLPSRPMIGPDGDWFRYKSGEKKGQKKIIGLTLQKRYITEMFVNSLRDVRILSTARVFDEGFDCEDIQMGIITSRTKNANQQIQRGGRVKRVIQGSEQDKMLIINIYAQDTDDKYAILKAQERYEHDVHWAMSVDDIGFTDIDEEGIDL